MEVESSCHSKQLHFENQIKQTTHKCYFHITSGPSICYFGYPIEIIFNDGHIHLAPNMVVELSIHPLHLTRMACELAHQRKFKKDVPANILHVDIVTI